VVLTTFGKGNVSVTGRRWHYIRYEDASEELYDRSTDPHEWTNLAALPEHSAVKSEMAKHVPKEFTEPPKDDDSGKSSKKKKKKKSKSSDQ
jgi:hypothetical protein